MLKYSLILVINSLVFFHLPLKEGHVPKRLIGVGVDAIVGGLGIGLLSCLYGKHGRWC